MNKNTSTSGKKSYRLLTALTLLLGIGSLIVCIRLGREAALGFLLWGTASVLPLSLLVTAIGGLFDECRALGALQKDGKSGRS